MSIIGYYIEGWGEMVCEKCIKSMTTAVELDVLHGYKSGWEVEYWPVRNKDGSTKKSPRGAVVMKKTPNGMKNPTARTFDGQKIFTESDYDREDPDGITCECGEVLVEPHESTCYSCSKKMYGSLAYKLEYNCAHVYCEECLEKLLEARDIPEKLDKLYQRVTQSYAEKRDILKLGKKEHLVDIYGAMVGVYEHFKENDSLAALYEYISTELEKYEYLAGRDGGVALSLFNLFEKIDETTYILDGVESCVEWSDLENLQEVVKAIEEYEKYGE